MFNVGGMELLVIGVVALIVLGPEKLPGAVRQVGQVVGELRRISSGFQTDLRGALDDAERDADAGRAAAKRANEAAPRDSTPDPGAGRAAAHAELEAAEHALDARTGDRAGAEGDAALGPARSTGVDTEQTKDASDPAEPTA